MNNFNGIILNPIKVHYNDLLLDMVNPRFAGEHHLVFGNNNYELTHERTQECIRRYLMESARAQHLMDSILNVGFLNVDKIIVRKHKSGKYVVVEGNRRTAAIITIKAYERCNALSKFGGDALSNLQQVLDSIEFIEVMLLEECGEIEVDTAAILIQGVRHISGVKSWGPYQQGYLINSLISEKGYTHTKAAETVGLSVSRVGTLLRAYRGLNQMMTNSGFGKHADTQYFSFFEQAYRQKPIRDWLAWNDEISAYTNNDELVFFYTQIIESKMLAREVRDFLPAVLQNKTAFNMFRTSTLPLSEAYKSLATGHETRKHLQEAKSILERIVTVKPDSLPEDDLTLIDEIQALLNAYQMKRDVSV